VFCVCGFFDQVHAAPLNAFDQEEDLVIGKNRKSFPMALPYQIWKPRMELWAQGLFVMSSVLSVSH